MWSEIAWKVFCIQKDECPGVMGYCIQLLVFVA